MGHKSGFKSLEGVSDSLRYRILELKASEDTAPNGAQTEKRNRELDGGRRSEGRIAWIN